MLCISRFSPLQASGNRDFFGSRLLINHIFWRYKLQLRELQHIANTWEPSPVAPLGEYIHRRYHWAGKRPRALGEKADSSSIRFKGWIRESGPLENRVDLTAKVSAEYMNLPLDRDYVSEQPDGLLKQNLNSLLLLLIKIVLPTICWPVLVFKLSNVLTTKERGRQGVTHKRSAKATLEIRTWVLALSQVPCYIMLIIIMTISQV